MDIEGPHNSHSSFFELFTQGKENISTIEVRAFLNKNGFLPDDPRWKACYESLMHVDKLDTESFDSIFKLRFSDLNRAIQNELIIPQFREFCEEITKMFEETKPFKSGKNADYIPQLSRIDPEKFGLSLCTIDGQRFNLGDYNEDFCVQSCSKPISYAIALETLGEEFVHKYVDKEPSGQAFNSMVLTPDNLPYNPMINAGAIMVCSLIERQSDQSERFETVLSWWKRLAGGNKAGFSNSVYLSERLTADRNFALAYLMKSRGGFPENTDIVSVLEFYFQCCSIESNCRSLAIIAATLANGGVCPLTHERVLSTNTTKSVLSLMFSCGMYDYSGQFAFTVGLPCKSGVSGVIMCVVPGTVGFCIWSPRLDKFGNSVRGLEFCKSLVKRFNFHNFDNLANNDTRNKIDPRKDHKTSKQQIITEFLYACMECDLNTIRRMIIAGADVNIMDYDKRTGLHIAASEGHYELVLYLLENGADASLKDRWDNTALEDAERSEHPDITQLIKKYMNSTYQEIKNKNK
jgi:glutaminase